jgi:hypothetical protein
MFQKMSKKNNKPPLGDIGVILLFALCLQAGQAQAQKVYPGDYFRPPVDFSMLLSGTFGEIRANHLHSGMDIKTNGSEGAKVYAVADGYISRINVSPIGFGKALYITHPNGYTSVYGHLQYFAGAIHDYVIQEHYSRESFELTIYLQPGEIPVKKGDIIAYSGNSGSSGGPHLHFEMRNDASQDPINPLLFGYDVKDLYTPRITWLKIYAVDGGSRINGLNKDVKIQVEGWGKEHRLSSGVPATLSGNIAFGIQCYDQQNDSDNKNGTYEVKVFIDERLISLTRMETFAFANSRYVNSLIDYSEYMRSGMRFQRTEIDPGNKLPVYERLNTAGVIYVDEAEMHAVTYEVTDAAGNVSLLKFNVQGERAVGPESAPADHMPDTTLFFYDRTNRFHKEGFLLEAPEGAFYRTFRFSYNKTGSIKGSFGGVHHVHDKYTPIQSAVTMGIMPAGLPARLRDKALVVKVDEGSNAFSSVGGTWESDDYVRTAVREFGNYTVAVDTIPPVITPVDPSSHKALAGRTTVKFTIKDSLSGIKSYRGTLNGKWILMDYDAKNDLLVYFIEEHMKTGSNEFRLEVTDMKGNSKLYQATMVR